MIVEGGSVDEIGRESEMIDPVGVGGEGLDQCPIFGGPYLDSFVLRGGVNSSYAPPSDTGD